MIANIQLLSELFEEVIILFFFDIFSLLYLFLILLSFVFFFAEREIYENMTLERETQRIWEELEKEKTG